MRFPRTLALAALALLVAACSRPDRGEAGPAAHGVPAPADDDAIVQVVGEEQIPAIDSPVFASVAESADFMRPEEPIAGIVLDGKPRAYSLWHLDRHELVNDRAGHTPLVVAWCPLAYTARAYERRSAGRELTFGVSGRLWRNALVMKDRETGTLWSQVNGAALQGPLAGAELRALPVSVTRWGEWSSLHPETLVLRKPPLADTLYPAYFADPRKIGYYGQKRQDARLPPKTHVIGVESAGRAVALPVEELRARRIWNAEAGGEPVLLVSLGVEGPELAYRRAAGGRRLTLELRTDTPGAGSTERPAARSRAAHHPVARDRETGSEWDLVTGTATSGPLAGSRLEPIPAPRSYWFIWSAYYPQTELVRSLSE